MKKFKWAILGAGTIAHAFAKGLADVPNAELYAVASRSKEKADAFAKQYSFTKSYGSYEEMAKDKEIDCVYIAVTNPQHLPTALLCIENGHHVLLEKPFAVNKKEAQIIIDAARTKGVFIMEAHWSRFLPAIRQAVSWIEQGKIGEVRMIHCDFAFRAGFDPESRLFKNEMGGGGLLDIGCYTICMATMIFGIEPEEITGVAHIGETNVDEQAAMLLRFKGGNIAVLSCGVRTTTYHTLNIFGENGSITIENFWRADTAILKADGQEPVIFTEKEGNGYNYEAQAAMDCIKAGKTENGIMTHADTLAIADICDKLRMQWGLKYPQD